jgi:predicted phosphate transport protein (TIGR00153 family)
MGSDSETDFGSAGPVRNLAMARLSLVPQKREFFDLFNQAARNAVDISQRLIDLLDEFPERADEGVRDVKELEHLGDRLTHELVDLINRTFVTPFDRDDMFRLAGALDDICDHVDDAAEKIVGYGAREIHEPAKRQAAVIHRAAAKLSEAIGRLEGFKDSRRQLIELRELEDEGDRIARQAIAELFGGGVDAIALIRWKDIYEQLEEAVDACENAADVLEAILVKNR